MSSRPACHSAMEGVDAPWISGLSPWADQPAHANYKYVISWSFLPLLRCSARCFDPNWFACFVDRYAEDKEKEELKRKATQHAKVLKAAISSHNRKLQQKLDRAAHQGKASKGNGGGADINNKRTGGGRRRTVAARGEVWLVLHSFNFASQPCPPLLLVLNSTLICPLPCLLLTSNLAFPFVILGPGLGRWGWQLFIGISSWFYLP
jgi:hypothetical protein